jgi:polysaccharide deacetylase family protein (PEP-CTERM system associated)
LILTIDVEDWFQVENMRGIYPPEKWELCESRVIDNIKKILELLGKYNVKATFFVLGWIAEKVPTLISKIYKRGHEIASHGYAHQLIHNQSPKEFAQDIKKSKTILENIIGARVIGYRAPSFSITEWAVDILKEMGYVYDSSYCPTSLHSRYGKLNSKAATVTCTKNGIFQFHNGLFEIPLPTLNIIKVSIPWGGGAYFRLIPYSIFKVGIRKITKKNKIFTFYFHPWEIDNEQPRIKNIKLNYKIRHYTGLKNSYNKLEKLLKDFSFTTIKSCLERLDLYPNNINKS